MPYHTLDCKKGSLITANHNKLRDGISNLTSKAFTPVHVHDDTKIFTGRAVRGVKAKTKVRSTEKPPPEEGEEKGILLIWYL